MEVEHVAGERRRDEVSTGSGLTPEERRRLVEVVREARGRAYAPHSGFQVGVAVLAEAGNLYPGCKVENASYGLAVQCSGAGPCGPYGACRQVILEFGSSATVLFDREDGTVEVEAGALLPAGFTFDAGRAEAGRQLPLAVPRSASAGHRCPLPDRRDRGRVGFGAYLTTDRCR